MDPASGASISFAALGDYGADLPGTAAVAALIAARNPDIVVTAGDNSYGAAPIDVNVGQNYSAYIGDYTGAYGPEAATNRFFPSPGNHDYYDGGGIAAYTAYFTLPGVGIPTMATSGTELYYDFVQGPVHFFIVDSNPQQPDGITVASAQASWLQTGMAASTSPWQVVVLHHPPFSSAEHGDTVALQWPFAAWGADLVIAGHDHTYERLAVDGIPYVVTGLGGVSRYDLVSLDPNSESFFNTDDGALFVDACSAGLHLEFHGVTAGLVDTHQIGSPCGAPPAAPTGLAAQLHAAGIAIQWVDESADETGFEIERSFDAGPHLPVAIVPAESTTLLDTTAPDHGVSCYRVRTIGAGLSSAWAPDACAASGALAGDQLPDLVGDPPDTNRQKLEIGSDDFPELSESLLLKFDGHVTNLGTGPMHVTGNPQHLIPGDPTSHDVWQWLLDADGDLRPARHVPILFETDDDHNHFHLMEIVRYSL